MRTRVPVLCALFPLLVASACSMGRGASVGDGGVELLRDHFDRLRPGPFSVVLGPSTEYHYKPEVAPREGWTISNHTWEPGAQRGWRVIHEGAQAALVQTYENGSPHWNPMVVAGDPLWSSYELRVTLRVQTDHRVGVAVHYASDRVYVFAGLEAGRFVLKTVRHERAFHTPNETVIAEAQPAQTDAAGELVISVDGPEVVARWGRHTLRGRTDGFSRGRIALVASGKASFRDVRIVTRRDEATRIEAAMAARRQREAALAATQPGMKLWKRIETHGFGVERNIRLGDLDGDGRKDILMGQVRHHGPSDSHAELSCLSAVDVDGRLLWRVGTPDPYNHHLTNDVAFQIHDLDGDGKPEVIYTMGQELIVAEGRSGRTLRKVPTPKAIASPKQTPRVPRILGDALMVADLSGKGRPSEILIKDRYEHLWAYDQALNPLWMGACATGHYPFAYDVDGDGRQEVMAGYCLFGPDGKRLWSWEDRLADHADGVAIVKLEGEDAPARVVMVASDEGFVLGSTKGEMLEHQWIGHAQSASIANLRDDSPGLEIVVSDFWANQGIILIYDARGRLLEELEPMQAGSPVAPVNWSGASEELFVLAADVNEGGLFNGRGERVMRFPADGHPDLTYLVEDMTGDERDEIIVWDPGEMWIYTQDRPATGPVTRRIRNTATNESNYRIIVSEPAAP